jgi:hypothetical protein
MNAEETSIPGEILSGAASGSTVSPPRRADLFHLGLVLAYYRALKYNANCPAGEGATR